MSDGVNVAMVLVVIFCSGEGRDHRVLRGGQLVGWRLSLHRHHYGLVGAGPFRSSICHDIGAQRILGEPRGRLCGVQRTLGWRTTATSWASALHVPLRMRSPAPQAIPL